MKKNYPYYEHDKINNINELINESIKYNKNDIAFFYNDENRNTIYKTYVDFYNDVISIKKYLSNNYKNEHIGIMSENSYNYLVLFIGIVLSNNVAVMIDKDTDKNKLKNLLKITNTKNIFYSLKYCDYVSEIKNIKSFDINSINKYINEGKGKKYQYYDNKKGYSVVFFTSGTTGANKAVMLTEENIANNIYSSCSLFKPDGTIFSTLPFHHAFGLITSILDPFYYHKPIFINSSLKNLMSELKIAKPNTMFLVPLFLENFYKQIWTRARRKKQKYLLKSTIGISNSLRYIGIDSRDIIFSSIIKEFGGNLKYIICGGAPLDKKYIKWFRNIGINVLNGYGITECSPVVAVNRNEYYRDGSVGQIIKDADVKIINNEIAIKSDSVMKGYYNDNKSTKEVIKDGYFYTGDLGYIDNDGFLFITGRRKNIILLSNGENVSPEEIESILRDDKAVSEVCVVEKNSKLIAIFYPNEDYLGDQEYFDNLIKKYNKNQPRNRQIALSILRYQEFPKNSSKKIVRKKVEIDYE